MSPLYLLQGIGMITVALFVVIFWKQRSQVQYKFFLWGGLSWLVATIFKSIASAPVPQIITGLRNITPDYISEPLLWLYIGLLTGVFECGVSFVIIHRIQRLRIASWGEALGYGLGFGATEALLLGVYNFVIVLLIILIPDQLPQELLELAGTNKVSFLAIPVPIVERAIVILLHAFSSVLIIYSVQKNEWKWFWYSLIYKTIMDSIAGFFQITYGLENLNIGGLWLVELILLPFGLVGLWGLFHVRNRFDIETTDKILDREVVFRKGGSTS
jgi:uncharacterized membrane protein YhfC